MQAETIVPVTMGTVEINSIFLERTVRVDIYSTDDWDGQQPDLLLINDGQDLITMGFNMILGELWSKRQISRVVCIGIHCGEDRKNEYGMVSSADFKGRGAKAPLYQKFIFGELMPYIAGQYPLDGFRKKVFAGFSLGGLSALDIAWNNPDTFSAAGIFSGSLWWRSRDKEDKTYNEWSDRMMHSLIRSSSYRNDMKFFFQCGELDENEDRNRNGVIDSIDDTLDLIRELILKGYNEGKDIRYLQMPDGRHDVPSWARAFPEFLKWMRLL